MQLFDVRKQLTFYGAYHNNPTNILIHVLCVPLLIGTAQVFLSTFPTPWVQSPAISLGQYLTFAPNWTAVMSGLYLAYYFALEPVAAALYTPQFVLSALYATHLALAEEGRRNVKVCIWIHALSWVAQFIGHGQFEGRAPALLDNILGAVVLAPFFVHLEILFKLGYRPEFHREIRNGIGMEIRKFRGDQKRAKSG